MNTFAAPRPRLDSPSLAGLVTTLVGVAWAAALALFGLRRLDRLGVPAFDNAYFQQLAWGMFHGHVFHASFLQGNFLGLHFSPILVLPALVELVLPGFSALNLVSALALGAVAPAAFLACRAILPETVAGTGVAVLIAVVLPFTPPLQEAAWAGFHPEELALPAILLATWAAFSGRWRLMAVLVAVVFLAREDQGYAVGVLGLLLYRVGPQRRVGFWLIAAALAWTCVVLLVVMPVLRHGLATDTTSYYAWLIAGGPRAMTSLGRTAAIAIAALSPDAWRSVGLTVFALCLLPLLRPGFAALALPPLLAATLSRHQPQPHLQLQYALPVVYPLVIAAALGGRRALQFCPRRPVFLVAALLPGIAVALSGTLFIPLGRAITRPGPGGLASVNRALQLVPGGVELDTDDSVATAAASRANLHLLPRVVPASYVLVDTAARPPQYAEPVARDRVVRGLPLHRRVLWTDGRLQLWGPESMESGQAWRVASSNVSPREQPPRPQWFEKSIAYLGASRPTMSYRMYRGQQDQDTNLGAFVREVAPAGAMIAVSEAEGSVGSRSGWRPPAAGGLAVDGVWRSRQVVLTISFETERQLCYAAEVVADRFTRRPGTAHQPGSWWVPDARVSGMPRVRPGWCLLWPTAGEPVTAISWC